MQAGRTAAEMLSVSARRKTLSQALLTTTTKHASCTSATSSALLCTLLFVTSRAQFQGT